MAAYAIQFRRGTTTEHSSFTGLLGEVTVDTTKNTCGYFDEHAKAQYPKFYHKRNDLFPLKKYTLGKMKVHGPKNPMPYLNRCYPEWCKKGIMQYDHLNRKFMNVEVMRF